MNITAITIENFKGIKDPVRIELKPIILLFGANSAGKSTIVQALHYAHEIFERQNINPDRTLLGGESINLGGFENMVYMHDTTLPIRIRIEFDLNDDELPEDYEGYGYLKFVSDEVRSSWVEILVKWSTILGEPLITSYQVGINGEELATIESTEDGRQINITKLCLIKSIFFGKILRWKGNDFVSLRKNEDLEIFIKKSIAKIHIQIDKTRQRKSKSELYGFSEAIFGLNTIYRILKKILKFDNDNICISKNIPLEGQNSAMPRWEKDLKFDEAVMSEAYVGGDSEAFDRLMTTLITGPGELIRDELRKICYIGPLREVPKRNYKPDSSPNKSHWSNGLAAYDILFYAEDAFIDQVNGWLTQEDHLATGYSVEVKKYRELEIDNPFMLTITQDHIFDEEVDLRKSILKLPIKRRLLIKDSARDIELEPQDIGVGISQVLPVVVAALHCRTGLVAIEQPELHIHPAFQVALGDLFIEQVRECPDLNFILETHSEHLMLRLLRRIRETGEQNVPKNKSLTPSDLSINFIEQTKTGISCQTIRVDQDGDFVDHWPRGFFAERAEELF